MSNDNRTAIGIDLGGTSIKAALLSEKEGLLDEAIVPTGAEKGSDVVLEQLAGLVKGFLDTHSDVVGVGVGFPGAVNWERTIASHPVNISGWGNVNVGNAINERLGTDLKVVIENDANAAALGSARFGAGRDFDSFIMITLGTGVGGAIIYQNRIFRGSTGAAGEIGHVTIDYDGPMARSSVPGAIEAYLGQRFLSRHARYQLMNRPESMIHQMAENDLHGITPKMLHDAALAGDEGSIEILAWAGHKLGCALGSTVNILDIRKFVIGGGLSAAGDFILSSARSALHDFVTPALRPGLEVVQETLGNEVGMLGAGRLVFQHIDQYGSETD